MCYVNELSQLNGRDALLSVYDDIASQHPFPQRHFRVLEDRVCPDVEVLSRVLALVTNNKWRWRRTAPNGEIVGASTQGYANKNDCKKMQ